ncbi:MAG: thioesterase family protein [Ilumatobacteraceae bacterium]
MRVRSAAVIGTGPRAAGWATRLLAAAFVVSVDDAAVVAEVRDRWPSAERLGVFPGASLDRLVIGHGDAHLATVDLVQVVGDAALPAHLPDGALIATDATAHAFEPIHLVPLVEIDGASHDDELAMLYASIGMVALDREAPSEQRRVLGPALVELAAGDDNTLIAILRALRSTGRGAGAVLAEHEAARLAAAATAPWQPGDQVAAPLALYRTQVEPEWVDYNGHMTEAAYLIAAGWASDALFRYIGDDETYRANDHSFYTVETHVLYLAEMSLHEPLAIDTQILGVDAKRVHLVHLLRHGTTDALVATCEQMLVHVHMSAGRSAAILPDVAAALSAIHTAHARLPVPDQVGSVMRMPPPRT